MKNDRVKKLDEAIELLKKNVQDEDSLSNEEKQHLEKLVAVPPSLMEALQNFEADFSIPGSPLDDDLRTEQEIIAENYITLARFTIRRLKIKNVCKLKAEYSDGRFIIYALTPEPVALDIERYTTSDYPENKELLLEAEALQGDLSANETLEEARLEIIRRIEDAIL